MNDSGTSWIVVPQVRGSAVNLLSNVIDYAFTEIKDRDKRIDFLDHVLEDFRKNAGEER